MFYSTNKHDEIEIYCFLVDSMLSSSKSDRPELSKILRPLKAKEKLSFYTQNSFI